MIIFLLEVSMCFNSVRMLDCLLKMADNEHSVWNVYFRTMSLGGFRERWRQTVGDSPQFPRSRINVLLFLGPEKNSIHHVLRALLQKKCACVSRSSSRVVRSDERHLDQGFLRLNRFNVILLPLYGSERFCKMKHVLAQSASVANIRHEKRVKIDWNSFDVALSHSLEKLNGERAVVNCSVNVAAETNAVFFALLIINYPSPCICVYS